MCIPLKFDHFTPAAKDWRAHVVRSVDFDNPSGHQNPNSMPVSPYTREAEVVQVGAFALSKGKFMLY